MKTLAGFWIQTLTGQPFQYDDPEAYHWNVEAMAHSLSMINRFAGQTYIPYSVAQHSVYIAAHLRDAGLPARAAMHGLLHDGAESVLHDLNSPLKAYLKHHGDRQYRRLTARVEQAMYAAFGIDPLEYKGLVNEADMRILLDEKNILLPKCEFAYKVELEGVKPLGINIQPTPFFVAKEDFMSMFKILEGAMKDEHQAIQG